MPKPFKVITCDRSTLAQSRQHQKCKHEKAQHQAMHDDQNSYNLLKKYFLIKYLRSNDLIMIFKHPGYGPMRTYSSSSLFD